MSTGPLNSAAPTTATLIGGVYNVSSPAPAAGQESALQIDASGNLLVNVAAGGGGGTQYADGVTQATPTGTVALGKNPSNILHSISLDASGNLNVNIAAGAASGTQFADNAASGATPTGTLSMGWDSVNSKVRALKVDANQNLDVTVQNASIAVTGIFFQATQPVSLAAAIDVSDRAARLLGHVTVDNATLAVTQSTSPWVANITQLASTVLGAPQTFGTAPSGVVIGTSSDIYAAGTRVRSNQTTTAAGVVDVNIAGVLGATNSVTNGLFCSITDGTTKAGVIAGTTALKTDLSSVAGTATVTAVAGVQLVGIEGRAGTSLETTAGVLDENIKNVGNAAVVTAAAGIQKVGISGSAAATLDAVITAATAPANAVAILAVNNTTAPSLTTGQSVAAQCDYEGSLFVKPYRRAQTVSKATTIASSSGATTVLAAQAAGIFADLAKLVITVIPTVGVVAETTFTATLSDGTNSYIYDMDAGDLGSTTVPGTPPTNVNISFNPPLPATSAAVAWTIALSVATVTVHITVVAVLQKAS